MTHTFTRGDTFWSLARQYNTTVAELQRLNPSLNPNSIPLGTVITIRQQSAPQPQPQRAVTLDYSNIVNFYTRQGWRLTSDYGMRRNPFGSNMVFHRGIDFGGQPTGAPVRTPIAGRVTVSQNFATSWGNLVAITDKDGFIHLFGHLHTRDVRVGQNVNAGDIIGTNGSTGNSTAAHLHYQINTPNGGVVGVNAHTDPKMFEYN